MALEKFGRQLVLVFIGLLPWSVIISVFGGEQLHIGLFRFWKEIFIVVISAIFILDFYRSRKKITYDIYDIIILLYILWLIAVSVLQHVPLSGYVYGLRYDAEFLGAFLLFRRILPHWDISFQRMAKIFLISGGIMLLMSFLIRFVFGEMIMTLFGFSDHISVWDGVNSAPPIYHGIPGASVIRFQGMLEGPNQMAFFLLVYMGIYASQFIRLKKYRFMNAMVFTLLLFLLMLTYSRSGYIGAIIAGVMGYGISIFQTRGKKRLPFSFSFKKAIGIGISFCIVVFVLVFQFGTHPGEIFGRHASTSGHFERMYIGLLRFRESPIGSGLASSGPASRSRFVVNEKPEAVPADREIQSVVKTLKTRNEDFVYTSETYYIPESWYIQQLVEGGIVGLLLFCTIMLLLALRMRTSSYVFGAFIGVLLMNFFLHSFESMHSSVLLFVFIASLIPLNEVKILGK